MPTSRPRDHARENVTHVPALSGAGGISQEEVTPEHVDPEQALKSGVPDGTLAMMGEGWGELLGVHHEVSHGSTCTFGPVPGAGRITPESTSPTWSSPTVALTKGRGSTAPLA